MDKIKNQLDRIEKRISDIETNIWFLMKVQETDYSTDPLMRFIIEYLSKRSSVKSKDLEKEFNIGVSRAEGIIKQLIKLEYITKEGKINLNKINKLKSKSGKFDRDPLFVKATEIIKEFDQVSASLLQRKLSLGYARTERLLDQLEEEGLIKSAKGSVVRVVVKKQ